MITGEKTYLAVVERTDTEQLRTWRNMPELRQYFREYREISTEMQDKWFTERVCGNRDQVDFGIHDLSTGELIGHCGLYYIDWVSRNAELAVYLGSQYHRGRGYGVDALRLLFDYGFLTLGLHRVWCEVFDGNAAVDVYRHLGFRDEGVKRQHHFDGGRFIDSLMLGLLSSEWQSGHSAHIEQSQ